MLFLALDAVRGLPELLDRRLELVLDVLVRRDARRKAANRAASDQLVVDAARRLERAADVVAQLLVLPGPLDVRFDSARRVGDLVLRLGHPRIVLSRCWLKAFYHASMLANWR